MEEESLRRVEKEVNRIESVIYGVGTSQRGYDEKDEQINRFVNLLKKIRVAQVSSS